MATSSQRYLFLVLLCSVLLAVEAACPTNGGPSLQSIINNAQEGDVLHLEECIYRETVIVSKRLTLIGHASGTWLRGSDIWTGWTQVTINGVQLWKSSNIVPSFALVVDGSCPSGTRCQWREQVQK